MEKHMEKQRDQQNATSERKSHSIPSRSRFTDKLRKRKETSKQTIGGF